MKVINVNEGPKMEYSVSKSKITFADELTVNLEKCERDYPVSIDICIDKFGMVTTGLGVRYAAQIEIPERQYTEESIKNPDYDPEDPQSQETVIKKEPVSFSMANVTLKLYAI